MKERAREGAESESDESKPEKRGTKKGRERERARARERARVQKTEKRGTKGSKKWIRTVSLLHPCLFRLLDNVVRALAPPYTRIKDVVRVRRTDVNPLTHPGEAALSGEFDHLAAKSCREPARGLRNSVTATVDGKFKRAASHCERIRSSIFLNLGLALLRRRAVSGRTAGSGLLLCFFRRFALLRLQCNHCRRRSTLRRRNRSNCPSPALSRS